MRRSVSLAFLGILLLSACAKPPATSTVDTRPALLAALDGDWRMTGDVKGKPVTYSLVARPLLASTFTELHMKDLQVPAQYEARVFIGYDKKTGQIIVHWLDSFGARYSIPHGTGSISGNTMEFQIPYGTGPFRDSLSFDPGTGSWSLRIEAADRSGNWQHFARCEIKK